MNLSKDELSENLFLSAQRLASKLEEIEKDVEYRRIFDLASIKGASYNGPTWVYELLELKRLLKGMEKYYPEV